MGVQMVCLIRSVREPFSIKSQSHSGQICGFILKKKKKKTSSVLSPYYIHTLLTINSITTCLAPESFNGQRKLVILSLDLEWNDSFPTDWLFGMYNLL